MIPHTLYRITWEERRLLRSGDQRAILRDSARRGTEMDIESACKKARPRVVAFTQFRRSVMEHGPFPAANSRKIRIPIMLTNYYLEIKSLIFYLRRSQQVNG